MKGSEHFEQAILTHLQGVASVDGHFKTKFEDPKKNIKDCITYILNTVQKSGRNGFHDDEIYGMAVHYYDEEKIEVGKPVQAHVVVNHAIDKPKAKPAPKPKSITEPFEQLSMFAL